MKLPSRIVDLSSPLENETVFDPPFMRPKLEYRNNSDNAPMLMENFPGLRREDLPNGEGWAFELVQISTHNGTRMDAPIHYHSHSVDGKPMMTIDQVPLDWFFRPGVKLDFRELPDGHVVTVAQVEAELKRIGHELQPYDIVLVNTRASSRIGTDEYLTAGCGMGREATLYLTSRGVRVTGIDALGWGCALRAYARAMAKNARSVHHLGGSQGRTRDSLLPHGEAVQSRTAPQPRLHRGVFSAQGESPLGRLDQGRGTVRLTRTTEDGRQWIDYNAISLLSSVVCPPSSVHD
jgi:kynurenine formamidase